MRVWLALLLFIVARPGWAAPGYSVWGDFKYPPGFTQFDLHLGYRHRWFDVALDVENLFNGVYRSAQFATTSRQKTEPAVGS